MLIYLPAPWHLHWGGGPWLCLGASRTLADSRDDLSAVLAGHAARLIHPLFHKSILLSLSTVV